MKLRSSLAVILLSLFTGFIQAQGLNPNPNEGTITVFSDDGDNFTLYINGEKQNTKPAPNVKAEEVNEIFVQLKVEYEDGAKGVLKKSVMRGAKDCVYMIEKTKKGELVIRVKSCSNPFPQAAASANTAHVEPAATPRQAAESGGMKFEAAKLTAKVEGDEIVVSNYERFKITRGRTSGNMPQPVLTMNGPKGAHVTITYDDNPEKYSSEVPFVYEVKD